MGTLNYTLGKYGDDNARALIGSRPHTSDAYTSTTTASFVEDGDGDIEARGGDIFRGTIDVAAWVAFGGRAATVGNDFYMRPDVEYEFEIDKSDAGKISIIDVA